MTGLANVWVRAVRLELIRADRIVSVSIGDPAGDGPGPATVFPESRSRPGDGMMLWLMASVADGAWPRAVPLRRYEVADVVPALAGLVGALAAAASRDEPALFVYPDMGVGTSWEIRKSLPGEWVILAMPGPRSPGPGAGSSRSRRRPDPVRTLTPNQLVAFNMARLRKAAGMSQEEFGAKMGGWSAALPMTASRRARLSTGRDTSLPARAGPQRSLRLGRPSQRSCLSLPQQCSVKTPASALKVRMSSVNQVSGALHTSMTSRITRQWWCTVRWLHQQADGGSPRRMWDRPSSR